MSAILTLVSADPNQFPLEENTIKDIGRVTWLSDNKAADIALDAIPSAKQISEWRSEFDARKTDLFITTPQNRRKKLLLADMDSTIVAEETLDELAAFAGLKDRVADITAKAMNGELDFHGAVRERVGLLKGLSTSALAETLEATIVNAGAKELVATMKANGGTCVLVSGGFTVFTDPIAKIVGFDYNHGNTLGIAGEQLTGEVIDPILDKAAKVTFLDHYCAELGIGAGDCMTIGDGANDLPMLQKAANANGLGIGYHAKPSVARELTNIIKHGDLSAALFAQGYGDEGIKWS